MQLTPVSALCSVADSKYVAVSSSKTVIIYKRNVSDRGEWANLGQIYSSFEIKSMESIGSTVYIIGEVDVMIIKVTVETDNGQLSIETLKSLQLPEKMCGFKIGTSKLFLLLENSVIILSLFGVEHQRSFSHESKFVDMTVKEDDQTVIFLLEDSGKVYSLELQSVSTVQTGELQCVGNFQDASAVLLFAPVDSYSLLVGYKDSVCSQLQLRRENDRFECIDISKVEVRKSLNTLGLKFFLVLSALLY